MRYHQRTLAANENPAGLDPHNFPVSVATTCHRSSYFSPYRVYQLSLSLNQTGAPPDSATFSFTLDVATCPQTGAYCCNQTFDALLIAIGAPHGVALAAHAQQPPACRHHQVQGVLL